MIKRLVLAAKLAICVAGPAAAQPAPVPATGEAPPARCESFYFMGTSPATVVATVSAGRRFCHLVYAVSYAPARLNPLWSAQHLTREMAEAGDRISRVDQSSFLQEPGLSRLEQAADEDFARNPWDKGHMAPANDAPDETSQRDTFVLSNAVPQHQRLNRRLWQFLEASVHQLAILENEVYIVTGPIFEGRRRLMDRRVPIPSATFKAIYLPSLNLAIGFIATNRATPRCTIVPVAEIVRRTGIDPFPAVGAEIKARLPPITLPRGVNPRRDGTRQILPLPDCRPAGARAGG